MDENTKRVLSGASDSSYRFANLCLHNGAPLIIGYGVCIRMFYKMR